MGEDCKHINPLQHAGTSQAGRMLDALHPGNIELHALDVSDWMQFAFNYAQLINFFPEDNPGEPNGDWQDFFAGEGEIESLINRYGQGDIEPHIALFFSFLKLLEYPQKSLNKLPERHLDFYYGEVLQLQKKAYEPDRVHVLFELARNAKAALIEEGTELDAGKDDSGKKRVYKMVNPLVVNRARVASLQAVYVDEEAEPARLRYASAVNSADGVGAEFDGDDQSWSAFGDAGWPAAKLGFYIASDLMRMQEGIRTITLKMNLEGSLPPGLRNRIKVRLTSEKGWVDAEVITVTASEWKVEVSQDKDPVSAYNEEIHTAGLNVGIPVLAVEFTSSADFEALRNVNLQHIDLQVEVEGIRSLKLQNELGNIDPKKPFMPFGSSPKVGSRLSVQYPELFGKPVTQFGFDIQWLNLPANFSTHYHGYFDSLHAFKVVMMQNLTNWSTNNSIVVNKSVPDIQNEIIGIKSHLNGNGESGGDTPEEDRLRDLFKMRINSPFHAAVDDKVPGSDINNFIRPLFEGEEIDSPTINNPLRISRGSIELILTESFYHELYPELYVNAVLGAEGAVDLPNEPYTPLLDQLLLSYSATETVEFSDDTHTAFFQQHPQGVKQVVDPSPTLVPEYRYKEIYIGLENAEPESNVSLLFQVSEGTENPLHSVFEEGGEPVWSVLSGDQWVKIDDDNFARNETNNFLTSGIVELGLPAATDFDHQLLKDGLCWIRIQLNKPSDAVPRFTGIYAQTGKAKFDNRGNSTSHLEGGLPPDTISKLVNPKSTIKSIEQLSASFGGKPSESSDTFYRRTSERLRHKNRAITIWDYEHLVLQHFPSLHKVKCINHSRWDGHTLEEFYPGNITLVLIPKVAEMRAEGRLRPVVSRDVKDKVQEFLMQRKGLHADVEVVNPLYEPVKVEMGVRFREGLDYNFYRGKLEEDIRKMMAPWVFDSDAGVSFGGRFTEYRLVNFIENITYVDFIDDFRLLHKPGDAGEWIKEPIVTPSNALAILVPSEAHTITNITTTCSV